MTVTCEIQCTDERNLPELLVLSEILRGKIAVKFVNGDTLCLNKELYSSSTIAKHILEKAGRNDLLGNAAEILEMENWMRFSQLYLSDKRLLINGLSILDQALAHASYLVGNNLTCADIFIWSKLKVSWDEQDKTDGLTNVKRYFAHLSDHPELSAVASCLEKTKASKRAAKEDSPSDSGVKFEEGGKFVELPGAEMGKVVVRFPPEASGYLHIGHAKAALLNQHYQQSFKGKLILRFDDTNPAKETEEFERVILEDVKMLGITHDHFSRTSDHFDTIILMCERLLVEGKAYVDDTDADTMKAQRERREESACRKNTVKQNMDAWEEMKKGTERGLQRCVRAKIDMQSDNGCLRDPTIYRCKNEPHLTTGTKYRVYPTYDFACPIVDSIEGVTHALRTTEYHDRDVQYYWFVEQLGIRRPIIYDYSRLNLQNTVLSKRKLTWFVQQGLVSGWDDPRFPTVRGILRKGLTIEGLKQFIIAQGSSKSICIMEWDKIWSFNKKVIDPVAPRYTALDRVNVVPVIVSGQSSVEIRDVAAHPKNAEVGMKKVWYGPKIWMEREDADAIANIGVNVTFINWGNLRITGLERGKDGHVTEVKAELNLDDKDFKKTMKVTWLSEADGDGKTVPVVARYFGHIISKPVLSKTDDFKNFINKESKREELLMGDPLLRHLKKGEIIQLQRRGFFIVDKAYEQISSHTGLGSPVVLIYIPDGHTKNQVGETQAAASSGGSAKKPQSPKKKGQKSPQRSQKSSATTPGDKSFSILVAIKEQGDKVRNLKTAGASKEEIGKTVEQLLQLKKDYRAESGADWKPDLLEKAQKAKGEAAAPKPADKPAEKKDGQRSQKSSATADGDKAYSILVAIKEIGDKIRNMKAAKASKENIGKEVEQLKKLKAEFRAETGSDWKPDLIDKAQKAKSETTTTTPAAPKVEETPNSSGDPSGAQLKKQTRLGLEAKKESDLPEWYSQVITKSEMIEYYDVSGCYILRPWAYAIWEEIKAFFDCRIKRIGVRNCYFPIFVSQSALEREKTHIADFAPEVAWVTKSGKSELAEPIAVRPTSETVMYPAYAKWVQSHRDLPILLNQWNNVVRWEFKHPQPFLRTREFLWQEGHTAHSTREAACKEVYTILDFYASIYIDLLAIPVVKGRKTEKEKFAGADFTTTVEAYISASGRAIQGATSHHLGQNFSKMFDIQFEDAGEKRYAHQNSWGLTTRTIGVLTMVHGDNKGLILPPRVACIQAVIVPCGITAKTTAEEKATLLAKCEHVRDAMLDADIRVEADLKDHVSPGWKFNHWELKGVPLRIEIGPKDMAKKQVVFIRRDSSSKQSVEEERLIEKCKSVFEEIHEALYTKAKKELEDHLRVCESFDDFCTGLDQKCLLLSPFCGDEDCEDQIKKDSARNAVVEEGAPSMGAKSLCIPFDQPRSITADMKCINPKCSKKPQFFCMFGRSY